MKTDNGNATAPAVASGPKQGADTDLTGVDWSWVEASVWTDRMLLALVNGVKGGKWFSLIDKVHRPQTLLAAWTLVRANKGAAGVDGVSVDRFAANEDRYLKELSDALRDGIYHPQAVRRVEIAKDGGGRRPLGIPAVKDRIVQQAMRLVIEPIFEAGFSDGSYGFRPGRGAKDALREVDGLLKEGFTWVVDADIKSYFDTIPHDRLLARIEDKVSDGRVLSVISSWLKADILSDLERWTPVRGTPQGAVISPLLANIYLDPLDHLMASHGYRMVRYADDFVILTGSEDAARAALELVRQWIAEADLELHPTKTHVGDCRQPGQGFEFLGYRFEAGKRYVRKKSLKRVKDRIRQKTKRKRGDSLNTVIADLNRTLTAWFEYFKHAHPCAFGWVDQMTRRRLRAKLRFHTGRRGQGHTLIDHQNWTNTFFADAGLFALYTAWQSAKQSR